MFRETAYVCGPLTELKAGDQVRVKHFYERIGDACQKITGVRAFVPHEHFDPVKHVHVTPKQVDETEREQICNRTSVLIVVAVFSSWGGGIEVEMANQNGVPVVLLCERQKLQARQISRLLRGNPAVKKIIEYDDQDEAISQLEVVLLDMKKQEVLA